MDIKNVVIIIGRKYTKHKIIQEIREEGYKHNFFFAQGQEWDILVKHLDMANEIWVFGDATGFETHTYAKKVNLDIWQMG